MARGKKKSIDDHIAAKDAAIVKLEDNYKAKLAALKADKKRLIEQKEREAREELACIIADSGLSVYELRELIAKNKNA